MTRSGMFLAPFLMAISVFAADPVVTITLSNEAPRTGDRLTATFSVMNPGTETLSDVLVPVSSDAIIETVSAPPGSDCGRTSQTVVGCNIGSLASGQTKQMVLSLAVRNNAERLGMGRIFTVEHAPITADLSVETSSTAAPLNTPAQLTTTVRNLGPGSAAEVMVVETNPSPITFPASNNGWSCTVDHSTVFCKHGPLAAGESSTFQMFTAPTDRPGGGTALVEVWGRGLFDPNFTNNYTEHRWTIGAASDYTRFLIPFFSNFPASGAFGSIWTTDLTLYFDDASSDIVTITPMTLQRCGVTPHCRPDFIIPHKSVVHPVAAPFDALVPAYFEYVESKYADRFTMTLKVQDLSRNLETWGTELPIVRDSDFGTGTIHLLDVPTSDRFRQTLRIYDDRGVDGAVHVRVFGLKDRNAAAEELITEFDAPLTTPPFNEQGPFGSPLHPAYAQIHLWTLSSQLSTFETAHIAIDSLPDDLAKHWAFVTVTNNDTQHVTTVTPQRVAR